MKIEKLNENQIRCTLTSTDLADRKIRLNELAYGTDKARDLFQDMMIEANEQFGFNYDNGPLMVEAIPVAPDSIVLIITKVDDPQELDTRFSKFAPSSDDAENAESVTYTGADEILDLFNRSQPDAPSQASEKSDAASSSGQKDGALMQPLVYRFAFSTLDEVIASARSLKQCFSGKNSLYRQDGPSSYQLIIHQSGCTPEVFNKICNILSEYGRQFSFSLAGEASLAEHSELLIKDQALQKLDF